jgi:hypothetical protein
MLRAIPVEPTIVLALVASAIVIAFFVDETLR